MASWALVPCLVQLRQEFSELGPNRSKESDGSIGDAAHADSISDHNDDEIGNVPIRDADKLHEVHAIDVTKSGPWLNGLTMERIVQFILARCRSGAENRLRYIIYNRRMWSASWGWSEHEYFGTNPHDKHAHFSSSYETAREASTASWHLDELLPKEWDEMATKKEIQEALTEVLTEARPYVLARLGKVAGGRGWSNLSVDGKLDYLLEAIVAAANVDADGDGRAEESGSVQARLARLETGVNELLRALRPEQIKQLPVPPTGQ